MKLMIALVVSAVCFYVNAAALMILYRPDLLAVLAGTGAISTIGIVGVLAVRYIRRQRQPRRAGLLVIRQPGRGIVRGYNNGMGDYPYSNN